MCGLFGWYLKPGEFTLDEKGKLAEVLIKESDRRGGDSWGVAAPTRIGKYELYKDLGTLGKHKFASSIAAFDTVYGHTRKATTGKVCQRNAHPFQVNHIIGAHNGMVSNYTALNQKHKRHCEVDSQHIFYHLSENKPLDELEGWGAFWWFTRSHPERVSLFKENQYNLSVYGIGIYGQRVVGVVFASDGRDVEAAVEAMGRQWFSYHFEPNLMYQIHTWSGLVKTDKEMRFGCRWYRDYTPYTPALGGTPYTHLSREDRGTAFADLVVKCTVCKHYTFEPDDAPGIGLVCPECYEYAVTVGGAFRAY